MTCDRWFVAALSGFLTLVDLVPAGTSVEPKAAVPSVYINLPEEMARLAYTGQPGGSELLFRWKAGAPAILEVTSGAQTNRVSLSESLELWPAVLSVALAQTFPATTSGPGTGVASIAEGKVDFWSLLKRLEAQPETGKPLAPSDAMNLADSTLLLAVEAAMNFDPSCYRLAARAVALSQYAARTDKGYAGPAAVRLAVALRVQGESALALQLARTPAEDAISQAWAAHVRMLSSRLQALCSRTRNDFFEKLWAISLVENGRNEADEALFNCWKAHQEDMGVFTMMVRSGSIVLGRRTEMLVFPIFLKMEPEAMETWAKRIDPAFAPVPPLASLKDVVASWERGDQGEDYGVAMRTIVERTEGVMGRLPDRPLRAAWFPTAEEVKALARGRREAVFWSRVRMHTSRWGVPSAVPMAKAWTSLFPDSALGQFALRDAYRGFGGGGRASPVLSVPMAMRPLFVRALITVASPGVYHDYPVGQWCEEQPAEAELALWNTDSKARSDRSSLPFAEELAAALRRHPQSDPGFYADVVARNAPVAAREAGLAIITGATNAAPEQAEIYSSAAKIHFRLKHDVESASQLLAELRKLAPDDYTGYLEGAEMLRLRGQDREALEMLEAAKGRVTESLSRAAIEGAKARRLLQLGQTNDAVRIAREAAVCGSQLAMENHRDVVLSAGFVKEAVGVAEDEWERYRSLPRNEHLILLPELDSLRKEYFADLAIGRFGTWFLGFFDVADRHDRLSEIPLNAVPPGRFTAWLHAALLRRDGKWEDAGRVLDRIEAKYYAKGTRANYLGFLIQIERERVLAKSKSLNATREEGYLVDGQWIGPFPNWTEEGADTVYPPETEYDPGKTYRGTTGIACRWKPWKGGGLNPFFGIEEDPPYLLPTWNTYYLRCALRSEMAASRKLQVLTEDGIYGVRLNGNWLDGKREAANTREYDIRLQAGENVLLLKQSFGGSSGRVALRVK